MSAPLTMRRAGPDDDEAVVDLVSRCLAWHPDDPNLALFRWKHRESPFGPSPAWLAQDGDRIVGFRTFMRWEFTDGTRRYRAVRAVDTATDPDYRGRGIFRDLTMRAVEELTDDGVDFVFNTPNDQSRPGYLRMGWREVGRLPLRMRPRPSPRAVLRTARARVPAELWSTATSVGESLAGGRPDGWSGDRDSASDSRLRTPRDAAYLAWRFGFGPLAYRGLGTPGDPVVVRVRSRGAARELAVVHVPEQSAGGAARVVASALRATGCDHAVLLGSRPRRGFIPVPGQGPLLTARRLTTDPPPLDGWDLTLGDVELF